MEDALRRAGITNITIKRGQIYWVEDSIIVFPTARLSEYPERTMHDNRPVLVLQSDLDCCNPACRLVLIAPLSHKVEYQDETTYRINAEDTGLPKDSLVELGLIQPILKMDLSGFVAELNPITMAEINQVMSANLGIINRPSVR